MALKLVNAVRVTSGNAPNASTAYNLDGATVTGYRSFANAVTQGELADDDTLLYYAYATDANGNPNGAWEIGVGTFDSTPAPDTLTRTTIIATSNNDTTAIDWSAISTPDITTVFAHDTLNRLTAETAPTSALKFWVHDGTDNESLSLEVLRRYTWDHVTKTSTDGAYTASVGELVRYDFSGASEKITVAANRHMTADNWTKGAGWTYDSTARKQRYDTNGSAISTVLSLGVSVTNGAQYIVKFELAEYSSGNITVSLNGGTAVGVTEVANNNYEVLVTAGSSNALLEFHASSFNGGIDNVSVREYMAIVLPASPTAGDAVAWVVEGTDSTATTVHLLSGSGDTINGVDRSSLDIDSPWRYIVEGECGVAVAVSASAWFILVDGRKPTFTYMHDGTGTSCSHNVSTPILMDSIDDERGSLGNLTEGAAAPRRSGWYEVAGYTADQGWDDQEAHSTILGMGSQNSIGGTENRTRIQQSTTMSTSGTNQGSNVAASGAFFFNLSKDVYFQVGMFQNTGVSLTPYTDSANWPTLAVMEQL